MSFGAPLRLKSGIRFGIMRPVHTLTLKIRGSFIFVMAFSLMLSPSNSWAQDYFRQMDSPVYSPEEPTPPVVAPTVDLGSPQAEYYELESTRAYDTVQPPTA